MSFGEKMRAIREGKGIGLRKLAKELGVSPSFVSQIEKNKAKPSIDTLQRITETLDISITDLIDDPHTLEANSGSRQAITKNRFNAEKLNNVTLKKMVPENIENNMEPTLLIIQPGGYSETIASTNGEEFLLILGGQLEITLNDKDYTLQEGDNIYFNANVKHSFRNPAQQPTKVLWVKAS